MVGGGGDEDWKGGSLEDLTFYGRLEGNRQTSSRNKLKIAGVSM